MQYQDDTLKHFFKRPAMYCGESTLEAILAFLAGYQQAVDHYGVETNSDPFCLPGQPLNDWIAYRLNFDNSTTGAAHMIRQKTASDREAIDLFEQLLKSFSQRNPTVVAKLLNSKRTYATSEIRDKPDRTSMGIPMETRIYPSSISLVTYTDDPGVFAYADNGESFYGDGFHHDLSSFLRAAEAAPEDLTISCQAWADKTGIAG